MARRAVDSDDFNLIRDTLTAECVQRPEETRDSFNNGDTLGFPYNMSPILAITRQNRRSPTETVDPNVPVDVDNKWNTWQVTLSLGRNNQ
jgi:hypothetical protein